MNLKAIQLDRNSLMGIFAATLDSLAACWASPSVDRVLSPEKASILESATDAHSGLIWKK
jgi:hypothetical protein